MPKLIRVSKKYFNEFKESFLYWQKELGLLQYRIDFYREDIGRRYALIRINESSKLANVVLNTHLSEESLVSDRGPESHARHEAMHLLLNRLSFLGTCRCIMDGDIEEEDEALTVKLTRLLGKS